MRKSLLGCVGMIGLIVIMGAALLGGLALGRHRQEISTASWIVRLPAHLTPDREGAVFLVSRRDACAYVSFGRAVCRFVLGVTQLTVGGTDWPSRRAPRRG